jgi:hypothetical protein
VPVIPMVTPNNGNSVAASVILPVTETFCAILFPDTKKRNRNSAQYRIKFELCFLLILIRFESLVNLFDWSLMDTYFLPEEWGSSFSRTEIRKI